MDAVTVDFSAQRILSIVCALALGGHVLSSDVWAGDAVEQYGERWCRREVTLDSDRIRVDALCAEIERQTCIRVRAIGRDVRGRWFDSIELPIHWSKKHIWDAICELAERLGGDVKEADTLVISPRKASEVVRFFPSKSGIARLALVPHLPIIEKQDSAGAIVEFLPGSVERDIPQSPELEATCEKSGVHRPPLALQAYLSALYFYVLPDDCVGEKTRLRARTQLNCVESRRYIIAKVEKGQRVRKEDVFLEVKQVSPAGAHLRVDYELHGIVKNADAGQPATDVRLLSARIVDSTGKLRPHKYTTIGSDGSGRYDIEQPEHEESYLIVLYGDLRKREIVLDTHGCPGPPILDKRGDARTAPEK